MENLQLYFIAIIPPPGLCEAVMVFKQDMQTRFGSKAAMKVVPHITLKAPFKLPDAQEPELRRWFKNLSLGSSEFSIRLHGFGAFPKPHSPVLFIKPELSDELSALQRSVITAFHEQYPKQPIQETELNFHPHLTIAYRDLEPDMFRLAWAAYEHKEFEATFPVRSVQLLHHDGKQWTVIESVDPQ